MPSRSSSDRASLMHNLVYHCFMMVWRGKGVKLYQSDLAKEVMKGQQKFFLLLRKNAKGNRSGNLKVLSFHSKFRGLEGYYEGNVNVKKLRSMYTHTTYGWRGGEQWS